MSVVASALDDKDIIYQMQKQYKKIKQNKNFIKPKRILAYLFNILNNKYPKDVIRTEDGILLNVSNKDIDKTMIEIRECLIDYIRIEINLNLIFKFMKDGDNIIILTKRNV